MTDAKRFLAALDETLPAEHQLGIWTLPERDGRWFANPDPALSYLLQIEPTSDVYIHVGIAPPGFSKPRAEGADLVGRHGYVADLDLSWDAAEALLARAGVPPTLLVGSGHGYHAWWLFDEPVIYDGDEALYDRDTIEEIAHDWIRTLRAHARDIGITDKLDGVHDLARILRVPGTTNNKYAVACPVTLIRDDGPRYSAEAFRKHLLDPDRLLQEPVAEPAAVGELLLRRDAVPPHDKFAALVMNHDLFESTWKHERNDELADPSPSGYDLALANLAALAGWTEQEIANLLIAHRRLHNHDLKLRQDYYARTIGKAMAAQKQEAVMQGAEPKTEQEREDGMAHLRELLDVPLQRIEYLDGQDPQMRFICGGAGTVQMSAEDVMSATIWQKRMYAVTRLPPRTPTGKGATEKWRSVCKAFGALAVHKEVGQEAGIEAETRALVQSYLLRQEVLHVPSGEPVEDDEAPFWRDGRLWLRPDALRTFGRQMMDLRIQRSELMQRLRLLGAEAKAVYIRFPDDTTTTRSFWGVPEAAIGDTDDAE